MLKTSLRRPQILQWEFSMNHNTKKRELITKLAKKNNQLRKRKRLSSRKLQSKFSINMIRIKMVTWTQNKF